MAIHNATVGKPSKLTGIDSQEEKLVKTAFALFGILLISVCMAQQVARVSKITIRGNQNINPTAILSTMLSKEGAPFTPSQLPKDEQAIRDMGFFKDAKVLSRSISDTDWELIVEVQEYPVVKEIRITGNTALPTEPLLKIVTDSQKVGQVYNLRAAIPIQDGIAKAYRAKGYFANVDIAPLDESPGTLNVQVIERKVHDIIIEGLVHTRPSVFRKLMKTKPGQAFNDDKWVLDQRRLASTQWFESIDAKERSTDKIGEFDLLMSVKEARTAQIGLGLALDPRSRLAGSVRLSDTNFRGTGQTISGLLQQDTTGGGTSASIDYVNPWIDSHDTSFSGSVYSRVVNYFGGSGFGSGDSPTGSAVFDERRSGAAIAFTRPFKDIWSTTIGTNFEHIQTIKFNPTGSNATNFIQQDGNLSKLNLQIARDRRDVPLDPTQGDYLRFVVEPGLSDITKIGGGVSGVTNVLGRHTFLRNTIEYKAFYSKKPGPGKPIDTPRKVLAFRARYGTISGTIPFFEQMFIGGSDSVRGYPDQRFWGKQSVLTSIEYRIPIQKTFTLIGFVDYGGAWGGYGTVNKFGQSRTLQLHLGFGPGIAFKTPLGPIRIDFGFNQNGGSRTHFSIGGSF